MRSRRSYHPGMLVHIQQGEPFYDIVRHIDKYNVEFKLADVANSYANTNVEVLVISALQTNIHMYARMSQNAWALLVLVPGAHPKYAWIIGENFRASPQIVCEIQTP